ncbi:hexose kinase [Thermoactinomyces mirandus]|uniref:Tagatose-6-phosphate kinase n=1 Tax=Thermoactinomyces mirandus TaxID=2756294 RepID=A0A7W2AR97_9BACL|nr:hexose kinase [Thermoactinomyces mirandus]MBA4602333.1 hexose kinase [Thermoactinomyces mirandus]
MICTITLNPSVDIRYEMDRFLPDQVNRVNRVSKTAGGKGLNVARVLRQLGEDVAASGFLGGSLGHFIRSELSRLGIHNGFVSIKGNTRNCIAIIHEGKQTEILESGPLVSKSESDQFLKWFSEFVPLVKVVTLSGSLPKGLAKDYYGKLIETANGIPVLLDTNGELLKSTLAKANKPFLIKPNQDELADLLGGKPEKEEQIINALKAEIFAGIPWVVVTLGADGAIVKHGHACYRARMPRVDVKNPVGSGDSVLAGFAAGFARGLVEEKLVRFGLAMGVLNAMEEKTGYINTGKLTWCMQQMIVENLTMTI